MGGKQEKKVFSVSKPFTCNYDPNHGTYYSVGGVVVTTFTDGTTRVSCTMLQSGKCTKINASGEEIKNPCVRSHR